MAGSRRLLPFRPHRTVVSYALAAVLVGSFASPALAVTGIWEGNSAPVTPPGNGWPINITRGENPDRPSELRIRVNWQPYSPCSPSGYSHADVHGDGTVLPAADGSFSGDIPAVSNDPNV